MSCRPCVLYCTAGRYNFPDSYSIKYNLVWQKLLNYSGPFPWKEVVAKTEVPYYLSHLNAYGPPMDSRHTYVKVGTRVFLRHFILKLNHRFTNTGSGQTQGKLKKETRFLCEARLARLGTYITALFHSRPAYL